MIGLGLGFGGTFFDFPVWPCGGTHSYITSFFGGGGGNSETPTLNPKPYTPVRRTQESILADLQDSDELEGPLEDHGAEDWAQDKAFEFRGLGFRGLGV